MPPQLREIGFRVENHATQWHGFQHEIQFQGIGVAWIQLTHILNNLNGLQDRTTSFLIWVLLRIQIYDL